ncbi:MAG: bifunctional DNA-formamidopyrimidine glycosylase/DNA-(apurinic or apyrimidinic site) lyase [Sporichthyaceae bacterium]|nr:bifunctional DNA-formamidopyrimidine glycosylase/DNA-(apurinic or apyrimidinic site) lyase [Sporichthyaceae bacterium]
MPELPEVEVVRRGLEQHAVGRTVADVDPRHPRALRRHVAGATDFVDRLRGRRIQAARRRGKYLWLPLADGDEALLAHLGMSGQLVVVPPGTPDERHLRVKIVFEDGGPELRFVDQRTFGGLALSSGHAPTVHRSGGSDLVTGPADVPLELAHVAADPLEEGFDEVAFAAALRRRRTGVKRALLDQTLVSGIGNIYADEGLWRARLHYARATEGVNRPEITRLLAAVRAVFEEALRAGGTSFDALYVDVNGQSGYFERSLAVYGQEGLPCPRCGTPIRRESFMNRSSFFCPRCQPRPRRARW